MFSPGCGVTLPRLLEPSVADTICGFFPQQVSRGAFVFDEKSCYKTRMVTKRGALNAIAALKAGDLSKVLRLASKAVEGGPPQLKEAFEAGIALGRASTRGEAPPPDAMGFLRFLAAAAASVGPDEFQTIRKGLGISQAEIAEVCSVSRAVVSDWERGKAPMPPMAFQALAALTASRREQTGPPLQLCGHDIARVRKALGMRQADVAAVLGVSEIAVRKWERRGDQPLAPSTVRRIQPRFDELQARATAAS